MTIAFFIVVCGYEVDEGWRVNSFSFCYTRNDLALRGRGHFEKPIFIKILVMHAEAALSETSVHKGQASRHRESSAKHLDFVARF